MAAKRHSFVQFYPAEWLASTARMPRVVRSLYFDLCVYTWETATAVPPSEVYLMISDLPDGQGEAIIDNLVAGGKLLRCEDGAIYAPEAKKEAERAWETWAAKSRGGRGGKADPAMKLPNHPAVPPPSPVEEPAEPADEDMQKAIANANSVQMIAEAWNAVAARRGLKQIKRMTAERIGRLNARIADHGSERLVEVITHLDQDEEALAAKPTFDAILSPKVCSKMVAASCGEPEV